MEASPGRAARATSAATARETSAVTVLGATGSIGESTLKVIRCNRERLRLAGASCHTRWRELAAIAHEFEVPEVAVYDHRCAREARQSGLFPAGTRILQGEEGLSALATAEGADTVLSAVVGTTGLMPTLAAIRAGRKIALASKEILVLAGSFVMAEAEARGVEVLPVDSEHNAIYQCLKGEQGREVRRLLLTASGGPFRTLSREEMNTVTPARATTHPNWDMGPKITVDSSTMANKGLEMIEARWLFGVKPEQITVVVHPQSLVHSMVEFIDGSVMAQMSPPSMTFAIQYALFHPVRREGATAPIDFTRPLNLEFHPPDESRFPCLRLAREAMQAGGALPAVFNAANEVAVAAFLGNAIPYLAIPRVVEQSMAKIGLRVPSTLEEVLEIDREARAVASEHLHP